MQPFPMRCLLFISGLVLCWACSSPYKKLQHAEGDVTCIQRFRPAFTTVWYKTRVDITGRHLSGLLLIKTMPDSSIRMAFSGETGFKFFDFGFGRDSGFQVHYILKRLNKKAVIKTLRKDFELVLMRNTGSQHAYVLSDTAHYYYAFPQEKGVNYYITDTICDKLLRMERASQTKPVVEAIMQGYRNGIPDTIGIRHTGFNFVIGLKRLENNVTE